MKDDAIFVFILSCKKHPKLNKKKIKILSKNINVVNMKFNHINSTSVKVSDIKCT